MQKEEKCWIWIVAGLVLAEQVCSAAAVTTNVSTAVELAAAIESLDSGSTIILKAGIYDLSVLEPQNPKDTYGVASLFINNKKFNLIGEDYTSWRDKADNTTAVVLKGTNTAKIVYAYAGTGRASTFRNITFDGGCAGSGKNGGAIQFIDCRFGGFASNCVFRNCSAHNGGATSHVHLYDCLFENNTAANQGGAAYCSVSHYNGGYTPNIVRNCEFRGNSSTAGDGGAVYWNGQGVTDGCTFRTNTAAAGYHGSAMYAHNTVNGTSTLGYSLITNCLFEGNVTTGTSTGGGAVCGAGPTVDCTFIGNTAANCKGGAILSSECGVTGCVFRANSAQFGGAVSDVAGPVSGCVFDGNVAQQDGGAVYNVYGGITGCVFTANIATNASSSRGGAAYGAVVSGCWFTNNVSQLGGALAGNRASYYSRAAGCEFVQNFALSQGGAAYQLSSATNCLFSYNQSTNEGGACQYCYGISSCVVTENISVKNRGGAFSMSEVYDSGIFNNYSPRTRGGAGSKTTFTRCRFSGAGAVSCGSCMDCTFTGVTPSSDREIEFGVFDCLHNAGGKIGVTNCLIAGCSGFKQLFNSEGSTGTLVNCTFADNTLLDKGRLVYSASGPHYENSLAVYAVPAHTEIVNCIFSGNRFDNGSAADLSFVSSDSDNCVGTSDCYVSNCLYEVESEYSSTGGAVLEFANMVHGKPHFAGAELVPGHPYTLKYASAARGRGMNMDWMAGATDLAGTDRILDGTVDIGCYECYLPLTGTLFIVK